MRNPIPTTERLAIGLTQPLEPVDRVFVRTRGRKMLFFGGCDYFRLSFDPEVRRAVRNGLKHCGLSVAASRVTTGNHELYARLELALARFFHVESATFTSNGYLTGIILGQALSGFATHAFLDDHSHGCLADGVKFLDCPVRTFQRGNSAQLRRLLNACPRSARPIVFTEGVFALDGHIAPLADYLAILPHDGVLVVDDAHGVGVLGKRGRGTLEALGIRDRRVEQLATFSKAFGVYGGAVLGSDWLRARIISRSRVFAGNTPLPLPLAAGVLAALRKIQRGVVSRCELHVNVRRLKSELRELDSNVPDSPVPIVTLIPRDAASECVARRALLASGIFPSFLRYPGLSANGCFRFAISSEHRREQLDRLLNVLMPLIQQGRLRAPQIA